MAHGHRAARKSNSQKEYWSPRPGNNKTPRRNKFSKDHTNRLERRFNKKQYKNEEI